MTSSTSPVTARVGYMVKQLQHLLRARMDDALREIGLSTAQYALLSAIEAAPGASGAELARRCFITPQSVNGLLGGLAEAGLIARTAAARHGRVLETRLSKLGARRLTDAHRRVLAIEGQMLDGLAPAQRDGLATSLALCIRGLEQG